MDKTFLSPEALLTSIASFLPEHHQAGAAEIASIKNTQDSGAKPVLPALSLHDSPRADTKPGGILGVIEDLGIGAYKEVTEHTGRVAENAAVGLGIGVAATLLAPEIAAVAGVAALVYGGYELATHVGGWAHDAKVIADPSSYSQKEIAQAHADLQGIGAGGTDLIAGAAGGILGGRLAGIGRAAIAGCEAPEPLVAQSGSSGGVEAPCEEPAVTSVASRGAPAPIEAPVTADAPVMPKTPVTAEAPVTAKAPVTAEAPIAPKTSVAAEAPVPTEAPAVAESPTTAEAPAAPEKAPVTDESASSSDGASEGPKSDPPSRRFKITKGNYERELTKVEDPTNHGKLLVREIGPDGQLGPELKVWMQHHGPVEGGNGAFVPMQAGAEKADLIISCFPDLMEDASLLAKHAFPNGSGVITSGLDPLDTSIMVVQPEVPSFIKGLMYPLEEMLAQLRAEEAADAAAEAAERLKA